MCMLYQKTHFLFDIENQPIALILFDDDKVYLSNNPKFTRIFIEIKKIDNATYYKFQFSF